MRHDTDEPLRQLIVTTLLLGLAVGIRLAVDKLRGKHE